MASFRNAFPKHPGIPSHIALPSLFHHRHRNVHVDVHTCLRTPLQHCDTFLSPSLTLAFCLIISLPLLLSPSLLEQPLLGDLAAPALQAHRPEIEHKDTITERIIVLPDDNCLSTFCDGWRTGCFNVASGDETRGICSGARRVGFFDKPRCVRRRALRHQSVDGSLPLHARSRVDCTDETALETAARNLLIVLD